MIYEVYILFRSSVGGLAVFDLNSTSNKCIKIEHRCIIACSRITNREEKDLGIWSQLKTNECVAILQPIVGSLDSVSWDSFKSTVEKLLTFDFHASNSPASARKSVPNGVH